MAEPYAITLSKEGDFDGTTPMAFARSEFQVDGQRLYSKSIEVAAGVIESDFFGLMSSVSPKVVGIAGSTWNPMSVARVLPGSTPEPFRQEVQLTPEMTHVVLFPGDRLAILTSGEGRPVVQLVVNELSESEHISMALTRDLGPHAMRFRIIKDDGQGFVPDPQGADFEPSFEWSPSNNVMVATVQTTGPIPARNLCTYPKHQGCYASVRFAGTGDPGSSKVHLVEAHLKDSRVVESGLPDMQWSKVVYLAHDDKIAFESDPAVGNAVVVDIELVRVEPGDRLRGRYDRKE